MTHTMRLSAEHGSPAAHLSLEHGGGGGAALVLQSEGHRRGDAVLEVADLKVTQGLLGGSTDTS